MPPSLPQLGVEAIVAGVAQYTKDIDKVNTLAMQAGNTMEKAAAKTEVLSKANTSASKSYESMQKGAQKAVSGGNDLIGMAMKLAPAVIGVGAAVIGAVVSFKTMSELFERGAGLTGIAQAFNIMGSSIGLSTSRLKDMSKAAAGTVSDIDLMKQSNMALAGATGEFAKKFSDALPKVLEIARVQAGATGQSVDYLFQSLVLGIKRASPMLIDNTGITLKLGDATEKFAASLGKTTADLTAEEQKMAILNAVLDAGKESVKAYGDAHETAAIKESRWQTTLTNTVNTLAQAVQPVYEKLLDAVQPFANFFQGIVKAAAPYIVAISNMIGDLIKGILGPVGKALTSINAADVAKGFFTGGARMIGALAGGMASAANDVITVVNVIAKTIASFLSGFSPPPEGPLSTIDIGGANVIKAWLEGFMGVSLDPVQQVAAQVSELLGGVGTASAEEVASRLKSLDAALQPFQDRLALVRAEFDALKPVSDAAFSSIDRQMESALKALNAGEAGSAEMVRQLDNQKTALQDYIDAQQAQIDQSQIQLSLAQAQQAQERAALEMRKRVVGEPATNNMAPMGYGIGMPGSVEAAKATKDVAAAVAGDLTPSVSTASTAISDFDKSVSTAMTGVKQAFGEGFSAAGGNVKQLQSNFEDMKKNVSGLGDKISEIWTNISTTISSKITELQQTLGDTWDTIRTKVEDTWTLIQTSIETTWNNIKTTVETVWPLVQQFLSDTWDSIKTKIDTTIGDIAKALGLNWDDIKTKIQTTWNSVIEWINVNLVGPIRNAFNTVANAITNALQPIFNWINDMVNRVRELLNLIGISTPFYQGYSGGGSGTRGYGSGGVSGFGDFEGMHSAGTWVVGKGAQPQLFTSDVPTYGIPNIDKVLASVAGLVAQPAPMVAPAYSYSSTYNNQRTMGDININGVQGADDARRRFAMLRAMGRI